jgi:hypothetical protein
MRKSLPPVRFLLGVRSFLRTLTMVPVSLEATYLLHSCVLSFESILVGPRRWTLSDP